MFDLQFCMLVKNNTRMSLRGLHKAHYPIFFSYKKERKGRMTWGGTKAILIRIMQSKLSAPFFYLLEVRLIWRLLNCVVVNLFYNHELSLEIATKSQMIK